ncbi:flagellar basal body protein FliL [Aliarcobacter trophiarum LMG 25534]|uniref:Flagellar protein FliL n=1 Tax=Aliarcobacter trophiarum LMG 25534 TaxID=1032241 RepID=A0AAD0QHU8_9BACT|nr:flagellar basal body-associated FliL family protein [Aliarcobacter trophiarum]AXK48089.1 flagellar motor-associated protein FliL [Aliarcobacter trophiarum LMG 25534]RXI27764.1 flagellar basal body protein FliL [Aliarcobacter trophiarum]RXJ93232.1 flagellar basal body protein FliL [Aliarcobacter trophiarum LMG 25534]
MAEDTEVVKKSSDGKGLLIVLLVLIIILIMAVAGGTYFLLNKISSSNQNSSGNTEEVVKSTPSLSNAEAKFKADVNELVLNLTDSKGREKIMKLSFSIRSSDPTIDKIVQDYLAEITDVVITQISSRSSEELLTVGGKNLLKDELIGEINNVINFVTKTNSNVVSNILFTTFVIK